MRGGAAPAPERHRQPSPPPRKVRAGLEVYQAGSVQPSEMSAPGFGPSDVPVTAAGGWVAGGLAVDGSFVVGRRLRVAAAVVLEDRGVRRDPAAQARDAARFVQQQQQQRQQHQHRPGRIRIRRTRVEHPRSQAVQLDVFVFVHRDTRDQP
ncbi:hypothetical protein DIPPA_26635 [Diplonema papillatum]|nr:hypothetical protein DIPPA_26635 [Diplonema papillatum]